MKPVTLSKRLQAVASMVTGGNRVCDVGCDHGFVPIYLIEQRISPRVLAMDVRRGPLNAAKEHIAERKLDRQIETRISDGLHNYNVGEADTLVCAGMGGRLMMRILSDDKEKTESFRELILQPQSEVEAFRAWLREQGYCIIEEKMVEEDGKFYPMMKVNIHRLCKLYDADNTNTLCKSNNDKLTLQSVIMHNENELCKLCERDNVMLCKLQNRYGALLLQQKDNTLMKFLQREERIYNEILTELREKGLSDEKRWSRYAQVAKLLEDCRRAMGIMMPEENG